MLAIEKTKGGFSDKWMEYCVKNEIPFKLVDCYQNDILSQLKGCQAFLWQFYQGNRIDNLIAKSIIKSVEQMGIKVFPDSYTSWHFDDKIAQKYLLDAIDAPIPQTWIFYFKYDAIEWAKNTTYPKVFKLRNGAGSQNVKLVRNSKSALSLIRKAFSKGFSAYDPSSSFKERWRKFRIGNGSIIDLAEGLVRYIIPPEYSRARGKEKGYVYFQEFIPNNDHDIRIIVIGNKAFAIKRMVRKNDFRASGSGNISYEPDEIGIDMLKLSFALSKRLKSQCTAYDYIRHNNNPLLIEISYGFTPDGYNSCKGYWDDKIAWHEGDFDPYGWMIENLLSAE